MTDQIINSLLEAYKQKVRDRQGSTHELLSDPIFTSLPVEKQVEVVQSHSASLAQDITRPRLHRILAKAILQGAGTGVLSSLPAMLMLKTMPARIALGTLGAAGGALLGTVGAGLSYVSEKNRHETTNKYLIQLAKNPGDVPTAVKVLDMNRKYEPLTMTRILKGWGSPEAPIINQAGNVATRWGAEKLKPLEEKELLNNAGS